jgi:hypothetical protein
LSFYRKLLGRSSDGVVGFSDGLLIRASTQHPVGDPTGVVGIGGVPQELGASVPVGPDAVLPPVRQQGKDLGFVAGFFPQQVVQGDAGPATGLL